MQVLVQEFPYPPYTKDVGFEDVYRIILPVIAVLSFLFLCPSLLKRVVEEKQSGIKVRILMDLVSQNASIWYFSGINEVNGTSVMDVVDWVAVSCFSEQFIIHHSDCNFIENAMV